MAVNSSKKRKIDDFFTPKHPACSFTYPSNPMLLRERNYTDSQQVPGLGLCPNFITQEEETIILNLLNDSTRFQWRTDLSRRTMHFGGSYCLMPTGSESTAPEIIQAPPIPDDLSWLIQRFVDREIFDDEHRPQYCIVNEYVGSQGISAHTESFQFGEPVVGLSLLCSCPIRFHELVEPYDGSVRSERAATAEKTGRSVDVQMPKRSLLIMRGPSRWQWQHEVVRNRKGRGIGWKRISLTFRYKTVD